VLRLRLRGEWKRHFVGWESRKLVGGIGSCSLWVWRAFEGWLGGGECPWAVVLWWAQRVLIEEGVVHLESLASALAGSVYLT
jgi:hypothetical protein